MSWIEEKGPDRDVVLSSRIRLARNIAGYPFPTMMKDSDAREILDVVKRCFSVSTPFSGRRYSVTHIKDLPMVDRQVLVEKHLASIDLMQHSDVAALIMDDRQRVTIMVNEEDHIRMQCILPGFQLDKAWEMLDRVDDTIEAEVEYSFDDRLGYLTTCPTNVGTGLRASVMMHLPALTVSKQIGAVLQTISKIGLTARGLYGEGSEALGNIYQISNQITLGPSEQDIINNLTVACQRIFEKERMAQQAMLKVSGKQFEDVLWRALGTLTHARVMEIKEFMALMSQLRLGVGLSIIPGLTAENVNELMILGQSGVLNKRAGRELDDADLNVYRAETIRNRLNEILQA